MGGNPSGELGSLGKLPDGGDCQNRMDNEDYPNLLFYALFIMTI